MPIQFRQENIQEFKGRFVFFVIACGIFFVVVICRLYYLQVLKGSYYRLFSNENTLKEIKVPAIRGIIYDRNQIPIVTSRPSYDITITPQYINDFDRTKKALEHFADIHPEYLDKKWKEAKKLPPFFPVIIARDVNFNVITRIRAYQALGYQEGDVFDLSGIEIEPKPLRDYPQGNLLSPTLGYVREISAKELARYQKEKPRRYWLGDLVGAVGLEKQWDPFLKGKDGYIQKVVNAVGREITTEDVVEFLRQEKAQHGNNMTLTIDNRLQKFAEEQFGSQSGGLVVLKIDTGEILAFVSRPQYDPSLLVSNVSVDTWQNLAQDPGKPLLNRAYQASYPPGSIYKIVPALAALEEGVVTPEEKIHCPGYYKFGKGIFKCWKRSGHGWVNLHDAIVQSCDVFFYNLGVRLGVDRLAKYARMLGLGEKSGLRLSGEQQGLIPTELWKKKVYGQPWNPGETVSVAIGQGYDLVTPLQSAIMIAKVVNGGRPLHPHFVSVFEDDKGERFQPPPLEGEGDQKKSSKSPPFHSKHIRLIREALVGVVNSPLGTARRSRLPHIPFGGKTGTAQVISEKGRALARLRGIKGNFEDHAWFVAFATVDQPKIAVSVVVEHGGHGSSSAAPLARDVIAEYYRLKELDMGRKEYPSLLDDELKDKMLKSLSGEKEIMIQDDQKDHPVEGHMASHDVLEKEKKEEKIPHQVEDSHALDISFPILE